MLSLVFTRPSVSAMAGHSKWANIKHTKARMDAKRSKVFAKIAREITIAARMGGGDADMNPRLRLSLLKARAANMPADNIQRAIQRGTGEGEAANFEELTYEVYGPHGAAILCEISTDNRNRTAADVRAILTRNDGKLASAGSVSRLFHRKGQIMITRENANEDELMELVLDSGAEDFKAEEEGYEILTTPEDFEAVHKAIEGKGVAMETAEITALPEMTAQVTSQAELDKVNKLVELLEDHDDVQSVYSNVELA